jgi:ATP synthase protein I
MQETAISYGVGALGSFMYLRMLNRSVDAFGAEGGGIGAALGQPRLLIPMALALGYNR